MNVFKNTNKTKKFILVIVFLILFSVCCPKPVHAILEMEDVIAAPCKIIYMIERGILEFLNNIFCDKSHQEENTIYVSPESIIKGKFVLMDPNIFKEISSGDGDYYDAGIMPNADNTSEGDEGEFGESILSGRTELRRIVSGWYYALRNLAIVALLSVLVYVGIRMIISSASQDKAKYKMMLKDWFIALCLLFSMHYIMLGILNISSMITDAVGSSGQQANFTEKSITIIENVTGNEADRDNYTWIDENGEVGAAGVEYDIADGYAQCLMLLAIIIYTIIFAVKYLIRMITIVFLILLAPITCVTYPLDKISDGKAQAYNRWFQEFLYNVIIQPFHLIIYVVLVGSATTLANTNVLYGIMCFAVMLPAEKLIKEMFGFKDKLGSPLGAFATGALSSQLLSKITSGGSGGGKKLDESNKSPELPPNTEKVNLPGTDGESTTPTTRDNTEEDDQLSNSRNNPEETGGDNPGINVEDNPEETGGDNPDINGENNPEANSGDNTGENDSEGRLVSQEQSEQGRGSRAYKALNSRVSQHYLRKYGTTKIGGKNGIAARMAKRGLSKAYVGAKNAGRKTIRGATTLAGAAALGLVGAMFGQGKAGAAAGAALGNRIGGGITNATDRAWGSAEGLVGDMHNAFWDKNKENDKRDFKQNKNNILLARKNYKDRHGQEAEGDELNKELENMYNMNLHGINENQFNDTLSQYEDYMASGISEEEALNTAMSSALQAQAYSAKDFRDEKTMTQAYEGLYDQYKDYIKDGKISEAMADKKVREILNGGAKMKGVREGANLSGINKTVNIPVQRRLPNVRGALGIDGFNLDEQQVKQVSTLTMKLHDAGFSDNEIKQLAENCANSRLNADGVIKNYENLVQLSIEYENNDQARKEAEKLVRGLNASGNASKEQVNKEVRERFILKSTFNVKDESAISNVRKSETEQFKTSEMTQVQAARKFGKENKGRFKDKNHIERSTELLAHELYDGSKGTITMDEAKKQARNVAKQAAIYEKM